MYRSCPQYRALVSRHTSQQMAPGTECRPHLTCRMFRLLLRFPCRHCQDPLNRQIHPPEEARCSRAEGLPGHPGHPRHGLHGQTGLSHSHNNQRISPMTAFHGTSGDSNTEPVCMIKFKSLHSDCQGSICTEHPGIEAASCHVSPPSAEQNSSILCASSTGFKNTVQPYPPS